MRIRNLILTLAVICSSFATLPLYAQVPVAATPTPKPGDIRKMCNREKKTCSTAIKASRYQVKIVNRSINGLDALREQASRFADQKLVCQQNIDLRIDDLAIEARPQVELCGNILGQIFDVATNKFLPSFLSDSTAAGAVKSAIAGIAQTALTSIVNWLQQQIDGILQGLIGDCSELRLCTLQLPPLTGSVCDDAKTQCKNDQQIKKKSEAAQKKRACQYVQRLGDRIEVLKRQKQQCSTRYDQKMARVNFKVGNIMARKCPAQVQLQTLIPAEDVACATYVSATCGGFKPSLYDPLPPDQYTCQ